MRPRQGAMLLFMLLSILAGRAYTFSPNLPGSLPSSVHRYALPTSHQFRTRGPVASNLPLSLQGQQSRHFDRQPLFMNSGISSFGATSLRPAKRSRGMAPLKGTPYLQQLTAMRNRPDKLKEVLSGLIVALASIPTSIAFANIAGLNPLVGIWSSVILGLVSAIVGGCPGVISGAAGVAVVPLAPLVATHGVGLVAPTMLLAAALEMMVAALKWGRLIDVMSDSVLKGFLNGLGCLLIKSQIAGFTSLSGPALATALAVASGTGLVTALLPRITTAVPSSLVGVIMATGLTKVLKLNVKTLAAVAKPGTFAGGLSVLPALKTPAVLFKGVPFNVATFKIILPTALSIAAISALHTLLAGKVMKDLTRGAVGKPDNEKMLCGLSLGTVASVFAGGFGGCGLVPQTVLNVQSGGRSFLSSATYAASMGGCLIAAAPLIGSIPTASLAGVMLYVAISTIQFNPTLSAFKEAVSPNAVSRGKVTDLAALLVSSFACYFVDIAAGVGLGMALTFVGGALLGRPRK